MTWMPKLRWALALLIVACAQPGSAPPTSSATAPTVPPPTTTTIVEPIQVPVSVEDCTTPQVGFSPLCETYDLVQQWHMDRPIDPEELADAALVGLDSYTTDMAERPPRTLFCAIPDPAFTPLCERLGERVASSSLPVAGAIEAAVVSMAGTGLEPFTYYLSPEQAGSYRANGLVGGLGVLLDARDAVGSKCVQITESCPLEVVFVLEDNPGSEAGLVAGDRIVEVDGDPVDGLGFVDTATRIAGDETGSVEIELERAGESMVLSIERAPLVVPTVEIDIPRQGVGYLRIPDFESDIPGLVGDGLAELRSQSLDRLIVDLRDNPGGYIDAAVEVASEFIGDGVVVRTVGPGQDQDYMAVGRGAAIDALLTVVVNAGTASAAEILATALHDRRDAEIIGEATYGKDAVQIAFELNNGGEFNVAVARWLSPNGTTVAGSGVIPDRVVEVSSTLSPSQLADLAIGP